MKRLTDIYCSIYIKIVVLLIVSAVISGSVFLTLVSMSNGFVERYMEQSDYLNKQKKKAVDQLQKYAIDKHVCSRDSKLISEWVGNQGIISLSIYKDGILVYDSDYPDQEVWDEEIRLESYEWISYDAVRFEDGVAEVVMSGAYRYQIYTYIRIIAICNSFFVFLVIVLLGIRIKMSYIRELSREVELIEGGNLDCPITVKEKDELAVLAEGLDNMRKSFMESQKKEQEIVQKNQRVITEMSHDLRTPTTVIILYTEILKNGKYQSKEQELEYVEKINRKAQQIKERTDRLLEYSITAENRELKDMEKDTFTGAFYDLLNDSCEYLTQKGFRVDVKVNWSDVQIRYNVDYIMRIMDNIISNMIKYANPAFPVIIRSTGQSGTAGLLFQNTVLEIGEEKYGTGIGVQSIENLMREMNGTCRSGSAGRKYWIEIRFPIA